MGNDNEAVQIILKIKLLHWGNTMVRWSQREESWSIIDPPSMCDGISITVIQLLINDQISTDRI